MIEVFRAASEVQFVCEARNWRFCFIGGLALQQWGEPRETADVDLTLLTGFGGEDPFIVALLQLFQPRIPDAGQFALDHRVLLLRSQSGVGLDIAFGGLPFEESVIARSVMVQFPDAQRLRICTAEDLIVFKSFAARAKDWMDVEGILVRQTGKLDWSYIIAQLAPLADLKGAPEILEQLERRRIEFEK